MTPRILVAAVLFMSSAVSPAGAETDLCEKEMTRAAAKYEIPLGILYAVGLTETGGGGHLHAYALNLQGDAVYSLNKQQAIARFHAAWAAGVRLIDVGCMQLNYYYHGKNFSSVEEMMDPQKNVDYAARFLKELKQSEGVWTIAVARYNAGKNNDPAQKRYVCKVLDRLVGSGFGSWTSRALAFCESERQQQVKAATPAPQPSWTTRLTGRLQTTTAEPRQAWTTSLAQVR
jgi:soluble lytic murein transglycosylase-like protein